MFLPPPVSCRQWHGVSFIRARKLGPIRRRGRQSDNFCTCFEPQSPLTSVPCTLYGKHLIPLDRTQTQSGGWVIPPAVTVSIAAPPLCGRPMSWWCSPCPECNRNSPFVMLHIFCWAQLIPAFCLPDTHIRGSKIFHLRIEAFSKADDLKESSWIERYYIENGSWCISLPPPSI